MCGKSPCPLSGVQHMIIQCHRNLQFTRCLQKALQPCPAPQRGIDPEGIGLRIITVLRIALQVDQQVLHALLLELRRHLRGLLKVRDLPPLVKQQPLLFDSHQNIQKQRIIDLLRAILHSLALQIAAIACRHGTVIRVSRLQKPVVYLPVPGNDTSGVGQHRACFYPGIRKAPAIQKLSVHTVDGHHFGGAGDRDPGVGIPLCQYGHIPSVVDIHSVHGQHGPGGLRLKGQPEAVIILYISIQHIRTAACSDVRNILKFHDGARAVGIQIIALRFIRGPRHIRQDSQAHHRKLCAILFDPVKGNPHPKTVFLKRKRQGHPYGGLYQIIAHIQLPVLQTARRRVIHLKQRRIHDNPQTGSYIRIAQLKERGRPHPPHGIQRLRIKIFVRGRRTPFLSGVLIHNRHDGIILLQRQPVPLIFQHGVRAPRRRINHRRTAVHFLLPAAAPQNKQGGQQEKPKHIFSFSHENRYLASTMTSFTKVINCMLRENNSATDAQISIMVNRDKNVTTAVFPTE